MKSDHQNNAPNGSQLARSSAKSQQVNLWSKADFLDRAKELKRRLEVWQIDDSGPVWIPRGVEFLRALERSFRDSVLYGEHDTGLTFGRPTQLIPYSNDGSVRIDGFAGESVTLLEEECRKDITIWKFRDFVEHLVDAGDSEGAKLIRLTIKRLLDSPRNTRAISVLGDYVAGYAVNPSLLKDFLDAVTDFAAVRLIEDASPEQPDAPAIDERKANAVELWNGDQGFSWRDVATQIDAKMKHDSKSVDAFKKEIQRYAKLHGITLRLGSPGAKKREI